MENLVGIILFVLVVFSLLRGFMLYPKTKDSFGMGKEYSSTTSTICGLLYIVVLIGLLAESWVEISVVCLIATFVLQLRPLIRAGNVQAMARVMGGRLSALEGRSAPLPPPHLASHHPDRHRQSGQGADARDRGGHPLLEAV